MKRASTLLTIILAIASIAIAQSSEYSRLGAKAQRYMDEAEWLNAQALYMLMSNEQPRRALPYGGAIVAGYMSGDSTAVERNFNSALSNGAAADSIFTEVRNLSFSLGRSSLYEQFLHDVKASFPWFGRVVDNSLMSYYDFRSNGPEIMRYAQTMLEGLPDDTRFLAMLARGQMLCDLPRDAEATYQHMLAIDPNNLTALLELGNYYDLLGDRDRALPLLTRAYNIAPTPYLQSKISQ
jgi:tetratricopeptide (TPR) repeat protein